MESYDVKPELSVLRFVRKRGIMIDCPHFPNLPVC